MLAAIEYYRNTQIQKYNISKLAAIQYYRNTEIQKYRNPISPCWLPSSSILSTDLSTLALVMAILGRRGPRLEPRLLILHIVGSESDLASNYHWSGPDSC